MDMEVNQITAAVVDSSLRLHAKLGPGLIESVYEVILARHLEARGLAVARQYPVSFAYEGMQFTDVYRVDLLVGGNVVVELKAAETLHPVFERQLLTYLRVLNLPVGLLINFGSASLGIRRIINPAVPEARNIALPRAR